ncbi:MAG: adenylyl-sulfate kinase [Elusimicrobiota bacterium]
MKKTRPLVDLPGASREGFVLCFTGSPSSGKETIARLVFALLQSSSIRTEFLDGADVRRYLSRDSGPGRKADAEESRLAVYLCGLLTRNRVACVMAPRSSIREFREGPGGKISSFAEIRVQRQGDALGLNAKEPEYAAPARPEMTLLTDGAAPEDCANMVIDWLLEKKLLEQKPLERKPPENIKPEKKRRLEPVGSNDRPWVLRPHLIKARRFHAYNVGLPRTGTLSVASIFSQYRSGHEFCFDSMLPVIARSRSGSLRKADLADILRVRDDAARLEMDSSGLNGYCSGLLSELFPESKFLFTFRDCYSWCESMVQHLLRGYEQMPDKSRHPDRYFIEFIEGPVNLRWSWFAGREILLKNIDPVLDRLSKFWRRWNKKIIDETPRSRLLIIKTDRLSQSLDLMAEFLGIPVSTLDAAQVHRHRKSHPGAISVFKGAGYSYVKKAIDENAGPLMKLYFPDLWGRPLGSDGR